MQRYVGPAKPPALHEGSGIVIGEFDIYGVYFPAFAVFAAIAFLLQVLIKRLLDACGFYRLVWHRAMFDLAMYVILVGVVTAAGEGILSLA